MTRQIYPEDLFLSHVQDKPVIKIKRQDERVAVLGQFNFKGNSWRFRLVDLRTPKRVATSWITLKEPISLLDHRRASALRTQLRKEFGEQWRVVLEWVIMTFQDNETFSRQRSRTRKHMKTTRRRNQGKP